MINFFLKNFYIVFFFIIAFILIDNLFFYFDRFVLKYDKNKHNNKFYVEDINYHHGIAPNSELLSTYKNKYVDINAKVCSDDYGFKNNCKTKNTSKNFDIAIIGDSFTEGVLLEYNKTFVGLLSSYFEEIKIANLGVQSYSPSIYYNKIQYLLEQGFSFNHVIVFQDSSDIFDELRNVKKIINKINIDEYSNIENTITKITRTDISNNNIKVSKNTSILFSIKYFTRLVMPFTYSKLAKIKKKIKNKEITDYKNNKIEELIAKIDPKLSYIDNKLIKNELREVFFNDKSLSMIEENKNIGNYSYHQLLITNIFYLTKLHDLLSSQNIKLSLVVYPWPDQVFIKKNGESYVKTFKNFCKNKCSNFINLIPIFEKKIKNLDDYFYYYIGGDVHFNENGNSLISEYLSENYKNIFEK